MPTGLDMRMYYQEGLRGYAVAPGETIAFENAQELWQAACLYFEKVQESNLWTTTVGWYQGSPSEHEVQHPRPMTLRGLALFIGVSERTYCRWYDGHPHLRDVMDRIADVCKTQVFEGAMAGHFNAGLATRHLGLVDNVSVEQKAEEDRNKPLSDEELEAALLARGLPLNVLEQLPEFPEDGSIPDPEPGGDDE